MSARTDPPGPPCAIVTAALLVVPVTLVLGVVRLVRR